MIKRASPSSRTFAFSVLIVCDLEQCLSIVDLWMSTKIHLVCSQVIDFLIKISVKLSVGLLTTISLPAKIFIGHGQNRGVKTRPDNGLPSSSIAHEGRVAWVVFCEGVGLRVSHCLIEWWQCSTLRRGKAHRKVAEPTIISVFPSEGFLRPGTQVGQFGRKLKALDAFFVQNFGAKL